MKINEKTRRSQELETICLGHISKRNDRCRKCINDEYNRNCDDYKSIVMYKIYVEDGKR